MTSVRIGALLSVRSVPSNGTNVVSGVSSYTRGMMGFINGSCLVILIGVIVDCIGSYHISLAFSVMHSITNARASHSCCSKVCRNTCLIVYSSLFEHLELVQVIVGGCSGVYEVSLSDLEESPKVI